MAAAGSSQDRVAAPAAAARIVLAGAGRVDITPPPGYETGGHGPSGSTARGYFGRLEATALYFEDSSGRAAALVSADLFGIANALPQAIAAYYARRTSSLPLERIVIAASHTHQGPGNFLSVEAHNAHASRTGGYDSRLRDFLLQRLIGAIDAAAADARAHRQFDLDIVTGAVPQTLFRNRSAAVFMRNPDRGDILDAFGVGLPATAQACVNARLPDEPDVEWNIEGCPRLRAVDRGVSLLRIRRNGRTAAMAAFLAVHPTVLRASTPLFSPDVLGIARAHLEDPATGQIGPVAFFNGAEGDITMRRTARTAAELLTLGTDLAQALRTVHDTGTVWPVADGPIQARLTFAAPGDGVTDSSGQRIGRLARTAVGGMAAPGGAEDDWTVLRHLGFKAGVTKRPRDEQGVKVSAAGVLTNLIFPPHVFPSRLPISLVSLGDLQIAVVPFEMSTAVGYRIRQRFNLERGRLEIIGLANEYGSYTTTADEYDAQDYMGAATLWGPEQAAFTIEQLHRQRSAAPGVAGTPPADTPGPERAFGPGRLGRGRGQLFAGLERLLGVPEPARRVSHFYWCEPAPAPLPVSSSRSVDVLNTTGTVVDRLGIIVLMDGRPAGAESRWGALWVTPLVTRPAGQFRFRIVSDRLSTELVSAAFEAGESPRPSC